MKTVLIVDDDKDLVESSISMLKLFDINPINDAYNGLQAVEQFKKHNPDVMLLDLMMLEYDGFYTLDELAKTNPDAKIFVVTGDQTKETAEKLKKYNLIGVFYKPVNLKDLAKIINQ